MRTSPRRCKNFRREGEYIVVDGTATQFTLRDGDQWTCIFNLRKPDFGAPDPDILGPVEDTTGNEAAQERQLMQRAPELEALGKADEPVVADRSVRRNQLIGGGILVLFGLVAGYFVVAGRAAAGARHAGGRRGVHDHDIPAAVIRPRWRAEA